MIARWEVLAYSARLPTGRGYLLRIHDDAGRVGLGEARALPGFGSGPAALEATVSNRAAIEALLRQPESGPTTSIEARFAVETAVTDLAAQRRGVTLVEQLGFSLPDGLSNSLLVDDRTDAIRLLGDGHRNFKLKAQGAAPETLSLLQCLHDVSEGQANIRIDANGSWDRNTALTFLRQAPAGSISFVEQPFPSGDLDSCVWLREQVAVPVALDEGIVSGEDVAEAARVGAASLVVIKPMYRGLRGALKLASKAASCGLGACVTHAMDGTVGRLAAMHVAAAVDAIFAGCRWPHGLYAPGLTCLADEPELQPDRLLIPGGHGLGCHGLREDELELVCSSA